MSKKPSSGWLGPILLLLLGSLNILSGAFQLDSIFQGPDLPIEETESPHYHLTPFPIVVHIITGIIFNLLGPLQFAPAILKKWPQYHKWMGRILALSALGVAFTGMWMNEVFPVFGGFLKYSGVHLSAIGLVLSICLSIRFILRKNVHKHRIWMMRAIALGLGPATQRLIILPVFFAFGLPSELTIGLLVWGGYIINLGFVEWLFFKERNGQSNRIKASPVKS
ncbi:MAG: DUF2306 domain-containing protein [Bacteroidota bacterium]